MLFMVIAPISSQDAETTEDPTLTQVTVTDLPTSTPIPPTAGEPTFTYTPSPTQTSQPTTTLIPTMTATMQTVSPTIPTSVSSTHTAISTITPIIENTEELFPISATATEVSPNTPTPTQQFPISATATEASIPTLTLPISATDTPTVNPQTPTSSTIVSISPTLASVSSTLTPTVMPSISSTQIMATITPTLQPTATIGGLPLRYIQGIALYQNHVTDDSGILLQVYTEELILVSEITTNTEGIYNIAVPMDGAFWILFSAEWHRAERIYVTEAEGLADLTLMAGDLNDDECINFDDFYLIQSQFNTSDNTLFDLNDDTQTDLSDVAMLAGNLNPSCVAEIEATSTPATLTPTIQLTVTNIYTPTPMTAISATITESPTITIEAEITEEP
jgi:hypothetical protein